MQYDELSKHSLCHPLNLSFFFFFSGHTILFSPQILFVVLALSCSRKRWDCCQIFGTNLPRKL